MTTSSSFLFGSRSRKCPHPPQQQPLAGAPKKCPQKMEMYYTANVEREMAKERDTIWEEGGHCNCYNIDV